MNENGQEKRETLANIVAEYRRDYEDMKAKRLYLPTAEYLRRLLDRIEAARKREKAEAEADALAVGGVVEAARHTPGNEAAMRAALVKIHDLTNALDEKCGVDPVEIRDIARAALAEPARNCDVMSRSMCTTHFSTTYKGNHDGLCDVQTEREKNIHLYYIELINWLLAPAAERKGENDGRQ